jgi:hypothetical protein
METICNRIQEEIAWDKPLDQKSQEHVLSCPSCSQVALEYSNLTSLLDGYLDIEVPTTFTDQVMARISSENTPAAALGKTSQKATPLPIFGKLFELGSLRLNLAYLCGAVVAILGIFTPSAG